MRVVSVNTGIARTYPLEDGEITTGIFKEPVKGPVIVRRLNLNGDQQADPTVHGGADKAVYSYASEYYADWKKELKLEDLPYGAFGENLTIEGLDEGKISLGDTFRIGKTVLMVTQPRMPCYKLAFRFGRPDMVQLFLQSGRSGVYFRVVEEGLVEEGDAIEQLHKDSAAITIADVNRAYANPPKNVQLMRRAVSHEVLPDGLRGYFLKRIELIENAQ